MSILLNNFVSKFINPASIIAQTGLMQGQTVADLGCGNGFYSLPAAQLVGNEGTVYAVDVVDSKLAATVSIANQFGYKNVRVVKADLTKPLSGIPENFCDLVIVGNILHEIGPQEQLIKSIYRIMKTGGKVVAIEWKKIATPFGPPFDRRIEQQTLELLLMQAGLRRAKELQVDGYHYAVLFEK